MTQDEIIEMAREVGMEQDGNMWFSNLYKTDMDVHISHLEHFAQLVAAKATAKEREACEALHEHEDVQAPVGNSSWGEAYQEGWGQGTAAYRTAIRARGEA
jgi:hypothetical protein